ncbi:helix-turn-helix domain-containing protein [Desulfallas sp. Bu1-1]|uniref:helix-turn-helix domain-containing protein n=1 Tax=Desulfallas sp. Bu1-1 TaxID=2787620 RepID=UPI0018A0198A|nr:helix-turn-helix domain-containing protein [Desulfallas sp. Bu1-1]MBF7084143.1 helix-turn-helix domain-containing protein [Desulfallas sp. Bu1-1]
MEKTLVILDPTLRGGFTPIPNAVLTASGLSLEAKGLYMIISAFVYGGGTFPGRHELAKVTGFPVKKVNRIIEELEREGYLSVFTPGREDECKKRH